MQSGHRPVKREEFTAGVCSKELTFPEAEFGAETDGRTDRRIAGVQD